MYYLYDKNSVIYAKVDSVPTDGSSYGILDCDLDLTGYYEFIVSSIDANHNILHYMQKTKPVDYLIAQLQQKDTALSAIGKQVATMTLSGADKDTLIAQLGQRIAALTLKVAKGGTA